MTNTDAKTNADAKKQNTGMTYSSLAGVVWRIVVLLLIAVVGFLLVGFLRFAIVVTNYDNAKETRADAIVVLTGGPSRIEAGLQLLQKGQGKRLLISGVHPNTSANAILTRFSPYQELFACCIDLDRIAKDTAQNAAETAKWVSQRGYDSLIVVTSDYHLPRSLLEMSAVMPEIILKPHAVRPVGETDQVGIDISNQVKLMVGEYLKTIASSFKL